ncbi:predicted protein [Nematostella vectensis]|uniref:Uncharacterized protein n=1 Tax=Nematostella vectensis TaxID=45351 RepID=A7T423_NEMVE|nr:predicted protein [Nematostella vectensis]|eukprot:XP_001621389.1 hypothetical protein NEMVEDRAFT_v1g222041 [Nematostella vectensis]
MLLLILLKQAYQRYLDLTDSGALTFDKWCDEQRSAVSQFQYWYTYLQLELLLLVFVRSVRLDDFDMYRDALYKMLPWFFALNHTHYSRWLRVHVKDMLELDMKAPDVARAFREGLFAVTKTSRRFSAIAIDQAQEQNNALVKGDGGAVGLTENTNALRRWMLSGPEIARPVNEFEAEMNPEVHSESKHHHEADKAYQVTFHKDVKALAQGTEKTFSDYAQLTFIPYILAQLRLVKRIDLVFDEYIANSLKATTRSHRGAGVRQRVEPVNKLPRSWKDFLRDDRNKEELFKFLGESFVIADCHPKQVISPYGTEVLSSVPREDNFSLAPCSHEEADTRMFLHAADSVLCGHKRVVLRTVDTDVLVLAVSLLSPLKRRTSEDIELWVSFGSGLIAAHKIANALSIDMALGLPAFHAFTGYDTVSCFHRRSKRQHWTHGEHSLKLHRSLCLCHVLHMTG